MTIIRPPAGRILVTIRFSKQNRDAAMRMVRLFTDLEGGSCRLASLCMIADYGVPHDNDTLSYATRKFHVSAYTLPGITPSEGLRLASCLGVLHDVGSAHGAAWHKAHFIAEPTGAPMHRDWVYFLSDAWDKAGTTILGSVNAQDNSLDRSGFLVTGDLGMLNTLSAMPAIPHKDATLGTVIKSRWGPPHRIESDAAWWDLVNNGIIWLNGGDALEMSRRILLS